MKGKPLKAALVLATLGLSGCVVVHTRKGEPCPPPPVGPDHVTMAEIDAIGKLAFDNDRHSGFKHIAERPDLSDRAQVHLIEAAFRRLAFENAKVDVLLTLVRNPSFSGAGRAALLDRLDRLAFENDKRRILDALNEPRV